MEGTAPRQTREATCPECGGPMQTFAWASENLRVLCRHCWQKAHTYSPPNSLFSAEARERLRGTSDAEM